MELEKFRVIASEPKDKNTFKIEDYDGLAGILENFQKKIFKIEGDVTEYKMMFQNLILFFSYAVKIITQITLYSGSKVARAGNMTNEMSQSGFSAVFYKVHKVKIWTHSNFLHV